MLKRAEVCQVCGCTMGGPGTQMPRDNWGDTPETVLVHTESGIVVDQMDAHKQKTTWKLLTQGSRSTVDIN